MGKQNIFIKGLCIFILSSLCLFLSTSYTEAVVRRLLPGRKAIVKKVVSSTVGVRVKLRGDRKALIINFTNLLSAESVSYTLTYMANGKLEGSPGTIHPSSESAATRELLFGTCSSGTCVYHTNIQDAKLEIRIRQKNGKTILKRYKIRV